MHHAHAFVDGAYLRHLARSLGRPLVDPHQLMGHISRNGVIQRWGAPTAGTINTVLTRTVYYDARPDSDAEADQNLVDYWRAIELLPDTELGFGSLRGRPRRQKGVDTLIAVDMLVGAFEKLFSVAILAAGDADFVPVVREVRRRGVMVAVAAAEGSLADELRRAADRIVVIGPGIATDWFPALKVGDRTWSPGEGA